MKFKESIYKYVEQFPLLEEDGKPSIRQTCAQNPKLLFRGICKSPARKHSELILSTPEEEDDRYTVKKASLN